MIICYNGLTKETGYGYMLVHGRWYEITRVNRRTSGKVVVNVELSSLPHLNARFFYNSEEEARKDWPSLRILK